MIQYPDCLICFGPQKVRWVPPTRCECRVVLHEECWGEWVQKGGPICIICRKGEHELAPPYYIQPQVNIIVVQSPIAALWNQYGPYVICFVFVWILFVKNLHIHKSNIADIYPYLNVTDLN